MTERMAPARLHLETTAIRGVTVVRSTALADSRGYFRRLFCAEELVEAGWKWPIAQINHSFTRLPGTVRGLHYQDPPHAEAKLVICLRGSAWDVALDLRAESPTFLQWHAQQISAENRTALLVPPGCAHGFQSLSADVELLYLHSHPFTPSAECGVNPLDARVAIRWPLAVTLVSEADTRRPALTDHFLGLQL